MQKPPQKKRTMDDESCDEGCEKMGLHPILAARANRRGELFEPELASLECEVDALGICPA
jgi:hypothetical protein